MDARSLFLHDETLRLRKALSSYLLDSAHSASMIGGFRLPVRSSMLSKMKSPVKAIYGTDFELGAGDFASYPPRKSSRTMILRWISLVPS